MYYMRRVRKWLNKNKEIERFIKTTISGAATGIIIAWQSDPSYAILLPLVDRTRAYIFRILGIDSKK